MEPFRYVFPGTCRCRGRAFDRFNIVVEVFRAFREIRKILVGQVDKKLLHVLAGNLDEVAAHAVADAPRTAVQHEPHVLRFVEAHFDEVISGSQSAQVI